MRLRSEKLLYSFCQVQALSSLLLLALILSCSSKQGDPVAAPGSPVSSTNGVEVSGLPDNPVKNQMLAVSVGGANLKSYQYAVLTDTSVCDRVTWSKEITADQLIADDLQNQRHSITKR